MCVFVVLANVEILCSECGVECRCVQAQMLSVFIDRLLGEVVKQCMFRVLARCERNANLSGCS